jgi:Cys-tRNA(Pro)/Cys-tRNA(Cys) deacylase
MAKKKDKQAHKTNAVRIVEAEGVPYNMYSYDVSDGFHDGVSTAEALGQDLDRVYKTLVTVGASRANYVCVIPVAEELDLKKAAKHFGEKKIEMIHVRDITKLTGYVRGGCSPVGMKKPFPTVIDISAANIGDIIISGGKIGLQMELDVKALQKITGAQLADITTDRHD